MEIELNHGKYAVFDNEDEWFVVGYKWYAAKIGNTWYAMSSIRENKKLITFLMHRLIMDFPQHGVIDHINRNGLDNRKINLRIVTQSENIRNQPGRSKSGEGYKGVYRQSVNGKYRAQISIPGKNYTHLGLYPTAELAAKAFDSAAINLLGKNAILNFPKNNY